MVFNRVLTGITGFLLLVVFGLVVFHAPINVYFSQFLPEIIVKSWKELILLICIPLIFILVIRKRYISVFQKDILLILMAVYGGLHVLLLVVFHGSNLQKLAGLAIDLRYILFFILVFTFLTLASTYRKRFIIVGSFSAAVSLLFAFAQVTILPHDFLKHLGYSKATIAPYLTVDQNPDYIRINGTLRGPNPLGVYSAFIFLIGMSFLVRLKKYTPRIKLYTVLGGIVSLIVLWFTYSRSALIGLGVGMVTIACIKWPSMLKGRYILGIACTLLIIGGIIFSLKDSYFIQHTIFHNNPVSGSERDSDDDHASSLENGLTRMLKQPFGAGIGSTGSASLYGEEPLVIENQYLFVAHESGWVGFSLFITITFLTLKRLFQKRRDWLALGVFASGLAWVVVGVIQPVMVDDTVSMVWWGAAAIALAPKRIKKEDHGKATK